MLMMNCRLGQTARTLARNSIILTDNHPNSRSRAASQCPFPLSGSSALGSWRRSGGSADDGGSAPIAAANNLGENGAANKYCLEVRHFIANFRICCYNFFKDKPLEGIREGRFARRGAPPRGPCLAGARPRRRSETGSASGQVAPYWRRNRLKRLDSDSITASPPTGQ
jgi:hypothetical protein